MAWITKMINEKRYGKLCWHIDGKDNYVDFKSREEAWDWGMLHYKAWAEQYRKIMLASQKIVKNSFITAPLECYCGYSYRQINSFLRNGDNSEHSIFQEVADILMMVLCSAPRIPHNLVLYRMVNDTFIDMLIEKNKQDLPAPIQEKGFMSTSLLKDIANEQESYAKENNLLKIFVPKDTMGVYVNSVTKRSEEEMLLIPNMYLGLVSYPYKDKKIRKTVFECQLISFY